MSDIILIIGEVIIAIWWALMMAFLVEWFKYHWNNP